MSNYPDSVDSFTPVTGTDPMSEHAERHTAEESAIVATQQELDATKALLADKSDTSHTHDLTHNHDAEYQPLGDYALDTHTHDTTHNHDAEYQPIGDYATKTELSDGLDTKSDTTHTHDLTHDHQEYFLSGVEFDVDGNPLPLPYGDAKTLGEAVEANTTAIAEIDTSTLPLSEAVDVRAATLTTQKDANEYFAAEFENKLDKAPTWGELAGRP